MAGPGDRKDTTMEVLLDEFDDPPTSTATPSVEIELDLPPVAVVAPKPALASRPSQRPAPLPLTVRRDPTKPRVSQPPATSAAAPAQVAPVQVSAAPSALRPSVGPPPLSRPAPSTTAAPPVLSHAKKLEVLEEPLRRASTPSDPLPQSRAFLEASALAEEKLHDLPWALDLARQAMSVAPTLLPAIQAVRRLLLATNANEDALPLFDAEARLTADPRKRSALLVAKAVHLEDRLQRPSEARAAYLQARELDRTGALPLRELLRVDLEGSSPSERAQWLAELAELTQTDPPYASDVLTRRARLAEREAKLDVAIEAYRRALELDGANMGAIEALKRLLAKQSIRGDASASRTASGSLVAEQRAALLSDVLVHEATIESSPMRKTRLRLRLVDLLTRDLERNDEAVRILEEAVEDAPPDLEEEVLAALANAVERTGDTGRLAGVLEQWAERTNERSTRIDLYLRMGDAFARAQNPRQALLAYEKAHGLDPCHVPTLQSLGTLYASEARWEALLQMHLLEAEAARDPARRATAHARAAEVFETKLDDPDKATAHHLRALAAAPTHSPSFNALARLYRARRQYRELLELHRQALETATDPARKIGLWMTLGTIHEDFLGETDRAIDAYEQVLALDPKFRVAIAALERAGERAGRMSVVVAALDREAALEADSARRLAILHRAGDLLAPADPAAAIVRYKKVLEIDAGHRPALASLGKLHAAQGQWDDLVEVHRREFELGESPPARALVAATLANLADQRLGRPDDALAWARRSFDLDPSNASVARTLERLLRARGATNDLRGMLETELAAMQGASAGPAHERRAAHAAHALGELLESTGAEPERAIAAYRKAKVGGVLRPDARDAVVRILSRMQRYGELVAELEHEASQAGVRAPALLTEAGRTALDDLGDTARAAALFDGALRADGTLVRAWSGLEDALRRTKPASPERLAHSLSGAAGTVRHPEARGAVLYDLSRIHGARSGSGPESRAALEMMLDLLPESHVAVLGLLQSATGLRDAALRERAEAHLAARTQDAASQGSHLAFLARRASERGEADAAALWERALSLDPENLAYARGWVAALQQAEPATLSRALRRNAALEPEAVAKSLLHFRTAQVLEEADPAGAALELEHALRLSPEREDVANALAHLLVRLGEPERAIDRLRRAAHSAAVLGHHARIARIQAEVLEDLPAATATLARAASIFGDALELLALQIEYLERDGQSLAALELSERLAATAPSATDRAEALLRAGTLALHRLRDAQRADAFLRKLHTEHHDPRAIPLLAECALALENYDDAREFATQWAHQAAGTADEATAWALAMRASTAVGDKDALARAAIRAVVVEGSTGPARQAYAKILVQAPDERVPRLNALAQALRDHLQQRRGEVATYTDLADILARGLGRPGDAADVLSRGIKAHPRDAGLRRSYLERLLEAGRDGEAVDFAERRVHEAPLSAEPWSDLAVALLRSERLPWVHAVLRLLGVDPRSAQAPVCRWSAGLPIETVYQMASLDPNSPLVAILGALSEVLSKLYPADLEGYGLSVRDKLPVRGGPPIRGMYERVAAIHGAVPFDLFLHRVRGRGASVEFGEPLAILLPAAAAELPDAAQIFLAARTLALHSARLSVVEKLTAREFEILVASAVRLIVPGFGAGLTSEDVLEDQARRIGRVISRKGRRTLEEVAPRYAGAPVVDYAAVSARIQRTGARIGLLVCDDLATAIEAMRRTEREGVGLDTSAFLKASPFAQDLMKFHCSDQAIDLRRRYGGLSNG